MRLSRFVSASVFLLSGCTDTHDYVGIWCGSVSWSWSYTYFDTLYEEPNFRTEDTCWQVVRTRHEITVLETLQVSGEDVPDGWCHYYAPDQDRSFTVQSDCGFVMQAQDQNGSVFTLEQSWRLESGGINLSDPTMDIEANFRTATFFDGNEVWGEATAQYSGTKAEDLEPLQRTGGLYEERDVCAIDGCWQGSFNGNVVTGPASCENLLSDYSFTGVRFEVADSGRSLVVNGNTVPTYPYLQSCELVAREKIDGGEWTYRVNESTPGSVQLEVEMVVPSDTMEPCELYWQASGGMCPS